MLKQLTISRYIVYGTRRRDLGDIIKEVYNSLLDKARNGVLENNKPAGEIVSWIILSSANDHHKNITFRVECEKLDSERVTLNALTNNITNESILQEELGECENVILDFHFVISEDHFPRDLLDNADVLKYSEGKGVKDLTILYF